ncbi:MAG: hypothetical protein R3B38_01425 [Patescibacteria group bacterium]
MGKKVKRLKRKIRDLKMELKAWKISQKNDKLLVKLDRNKDVYQDIALPDVVVGSLKKRLKKKGIRLVKGDKMPKALIKARKKAKARIHKK